MALPVGIDVRDDLVSPELAQQLVEKYRSARYQYYWSSNADDPFPQFHWHIDLVDRGASNTEDLSGIFDQLRKLYAEEHAVWQQIKAATGATRLLRVYVNAYTHGNDPGPHVDSEGEGDFTAVVYLCKEWQPDWAGETVIFTADRADIERSVLPKPGRVVIFPAERLHVARGISRRCAELRIVLVFKLGR